MHQSIKLSRTMSCDEVFQLQFIQQEIQNLRRYNLHVVTRPLDVVYNKDTVSHIKKLFTVTGEPIGDQAVKLSSGLLNGVDQSFLDNLSIKLDVSAPQVIVPQDFIDCTKPMVVMITLPSLVTVF